MGEDRMTNDAAYNSPSCTTLQSQEDSHPVRCPAIRALRSTRKDDISEGFDSLSMLLGDLRTAQDDAEMQVARAVNERDRLMACIHNKDAGDSRIHDFIGQLDVAEERCSNLHNQLEFMKKMYDPTSGSKSRRSSYSPSSRKCTGSKAKKYIAQKRRALSESSERRKGCHFRLPGRHGGSHDRKHRSQGLIGCSPRSSHPNMTPRIHESSCSRAESIMLPRNAEKYDTDCTDGDLWGAEKADKRGRSRTRRQTMGPRGGPCHKRPGHYVPHPVAELRREISTINPQMSGDCNCRVRGDSGIDSDSDDGKELWRPTHSQARRRTIEREQRTTTKSKQYQMGKAPLPFLSSCNRNSHHIGANVQEVMSAATRHANRPGRCPLPDIRVGPIPVRGPFLKKCPRPPPQSCWDQLDIDKYKIDVDPKARSPGRLEPIQYRQYEKDQHGRMVTNTHTIMRQPSCYQNDDDDGQSVATTVQMQQILCDPFKLKKTKRNLKQLLEELAEEFASLECVCQNLERDMCGRPDVNQAEIEEQLDRLEGMMEERRRQVCCLLKLYKQIKRISKTGMSKYANETVGGVGGGGGQNYFQSVANRRCGRGFGAVSRAGVNRCPIRSRHRVAPAKCRRSKLTPPGHCAQLKVMRDLRNIQRCVRVEMGGNSY